MLKEDESVPVLNSLSTVTGRLGRLDVGAVHAGE
jgi:hypothetical protein